jgi:hypothetical protein
MGQGQADAPRMHTAWTPFDEVDGGDGVFWDHAITGNVSEIVTPNFEDGFDYLIRTDDIYATDDEVDINAQFYRETSAAYSSNRFLGTTSFSISGSEFGVFVGAPRITRNWHRVASSLNSGLPAISYTDTFTIKRFDTFIYSSNDAITHATAQPIRNIKLTTTSQFSSGKLYMYRRIANV